MQDCQDKKEALRSKVSTHIRIAQLSIGDRDYVTVTLRGGMESGGSMSQERANNLLPGPAT